MTDSETPSVAEILDFLEELDFGGIVDPEVMGFIAIAPAGDAVRFQALVRPGVTGEQRETLAEWAASRFARFAEHGPEPDGWQEQSGDRGTWQLWSRLVEMPTLD